MDNNGGAVDTTPRSFPQVYNSLFVGHTAGYVGSVSTDDNSQHIVRLREGTGGLFGNMIIMNTASGYAGIQNPLFFYDDSRMLLGDAKDSVEKLVSAIRG